MQRDQCTALAAVHATDDVDAAGAAIMTRGIVFTAVLFEVISTRQ